MATRVPMTPEAVDTLFGEHLNAGDLDALTALYESSGTLVVEDGAPRVGHSEIRRYFEGLADAGMTIQLKVVKVIRAGDDLAALYNDWTATLTGPDAEQTEITGRAIEIVRRQADGSWRFIIDDPNARG